MLFHADKKELAKPESVKTVVMIYQYIMMNQSVPFV